MSSADLIEIWTVTTLQCLELLQRSSVCAQTASEAAADLARATMVIIRLNACKVNLEQAHHGIIFTDHVTNTVMSWSASPALLA